MTSIRSLSLEIEMMPCGHAFPAVMVFILQSLLNLLIFLALRWKGMIEAFPRVLYSGHLKSAKPLLCPHGLETDMIRSS